MILQSLRLRFFRNFEEKIFHFKPGKNIIIWNNGVWKTNILEALALPQSHLSEWNPAYLVKKWADILNIDYYFDNSELRYIYSLPDNKKKFFLEKKSLSKKRFQAKYPHIISFHPQMMELLYGSPSWRRSFLDTLLIQTFPEYEKKLTYYKKIIISRNKILARIGEWKSHISELSFWDNQYLVSLLEVYSYRDKLVKYLECNIREMNTYFFWKVQNIHFHLISKTPREKRWEYISKYIIDSRDKEIYQRKTLRWPHLDDFEIRVDDVSLTHYASRWEVKSIFLWLKFLWWDFILQHSLKQDILFLIDDIFSELDTQHMNLIYNYIWKRQCIISSIRDIETIEAEKIYL